MAGGYQTLLSRLSRPICAIAMLFYFSFMFPALTDNLERYMHPHLCPLSETLGNISFRARVVIGGLTGIYMGATLWNISRFFSLKRLESRTVRGMTRLNVLVTGIATVSSLFITAFDYGGMEDDYFGVRIPWSIWIEWMTCAPILVFIICALDEMSATRSLSQHDITSVLGAEMMIVSGLLIHINVEYCSGVLPVVFFIISCVGVAVPFHLAYQAQQQLVRIRGQILHGCSRSQDLGRKLSLATKRWDLARLLAIIFPMFALVYVVRAMDLISNEQLVIVFMILGLLSKIIYTEIAVAVYLDEFHPSNIDLLLSLKADEERAAYLKYVFHEARIPLQSIALGLGILQSAEQLSQADFADTIKTMDTATRFMSETFDNVLSLQKIEDGGFTLQLRDFDMTSVLEKVAATTQYSLQSKDIGLTVSMEESIPVLYGDSFRIAHVIANFMSNAAKFSPAGSTIHLSVRACPLSVDVSDEWCMLSVVVQDEGAGLTSAELQEIFKPYVQVHSQSVSSRGTGIGLSLCKEIIQLHGGKVFCRSEGSERGSAFGFELPLKVVPTVAENAHSEDPLTRDIFLRERDDFSLDAAFFLIVDDAPTNRKMLQRVLLTNNNLKSDVAADGKEAVALVQAHPDKYCCIFMDNLMPEMNGMTASMRIRDLGYDRLIIGLTGNAFAEDRSVFLQHGADMVLSKPLKNNTLEKIITFMLMWGPVSRRADGMTIRVVEETEELRWASEN